MTSADSTKPDAYARRLQALQGQRWKRTFRILNPYRWHIRAVLRSPALEVGCGTGRVLGFQPKLIDGVDHNDLAIRICREKGFTAFTADEFLNHPHGKIYQSLILSHLLEHLSEQQGVELINTYADRLAPGARIVVICPQEKGHASDATHVTYMDFNKIAQLLERCNFRVMNKYSFPFPSWLGKLYVYNENVVIGERG